MQFMDLDNAEQAVELLVQKGARLEDVDNKNQTSLFRAAYYHNGKMVECLLRLGANPSSKESHFRLTCLGAAIFKRYFPIAKMLLEAGADIQATKDSLRQLDPVFQYDFETDQQAKELFEFYECQRERKRQYEQRRKEIAKALLIHELAKSEQKEIEEMAKSKKEIRSELYLFSKMLSSQAEGILQEYV